MQALKQQIRRPHGPARLEHPLEVSQVASHRHLACSLYGICLDVVVRRHWISFTCQNCSLWPHNQPRPSLGPAQVLPFRAVGG